MKRFFNKMLRPEILLGGILASLVIIIVYMAFDIQGTVNNVLGRSKTMGLASTTTPPAVDSSTQLLTSARIGMTAPAPKETPASMPSRVPIESPSPMPTFTPIPTATPYLVRQYADWDKDRNQIEVKQWSDGRYSTRIVLTAAQVQSTADAGKPKYQCGNTLSLDRFSLGTREWSYLSNIYLSQGTLLTVWANVWGYDRTLTIRMYDTRETQLSDNHFTETGFVQFAAPYDGQFKVMFYNTSWLGSKTIEARYQVCGTW